MRHPTPMLATLSIQEPCSLRWEALAGDERQRFCGQCSRHVHNLSAMRADEAERLLAARAEGQRLCVTYRPGPDGRPLSLPERGAVHAARRGLRRLLRGLTRSAFGCLTLLAACSPASERPPDAAPSSTPPEGSPGGPEDPRVLGGLVEAPATDAILGEVALDPPLVMGRVAAGD